MKKYLIVLLLFIGCQSNVPLWDNGVIPYRFEGPLTATQKATIRLAMNVWEKSGVIKFVYSPDKKINVYTIKYIKVYKYYLGCDGKKYKQCGCKSTVGKYARGGMYIYNCVKEYLILHELGHCLGLPHEHQRPDRDLYIKIQWQNIPIDSWHNFDKLKPKDFPYPYFYHSYDYNSIMNYNEYTFSDKCGKKSIVSKKPINDTEVSPLDYKKIRYMYRKRK